VHAHSKEAEATPEDVYMRKFLGSDTERFEYISGRVFSGMSCLGANSSQRNLFALRKAALAEARSLVRTEQQERVVDGLRLIAAEEWLSAPTDSPAEANPLQKLPAEIRRELE